MSDTSFATLDAGDENIVIELSTHSSEPTVDEPEFHTNALYAHDIPGDVPLRIHESNRSRNPTTTRPSRSQRPGLSQPVTLSNSSQLWFKKRVVKAKRRDTAARVFGLFVISTYVCLGALVFLNLQPTYVNYDQEVANVTYVDALYFATITLTTVGYGDIVATTDAAKAFVCAFIMGAVVLVATLNDLTKFAFNLEKEHKKSDDGSRAFQSGRNTPDELDYSESDDEDERDARDHLQVGGVPGEPWTSEEIRLCCLSKTRRIILGALLALVTSLVSGMLFFVYVENMPVGDALYFSIVTLTTVGYGDKRPLSREAKLFSIAWITVGIFGLYRAIRAFIQVALEKRKRRWRERLRRRRARIHEQIRVRVRSMTHGGKAGPSMLLPRIDNGELNSHVSEAEFILFGLERLGKVRTQDIKAMSEQYQQLEGSKRDRELADIESGQT